MGCHDAAQASYSHGYSVQNTKAMLSRRDIKVVLPEIERTKSKGSTTSNTANEILAKLREE